MCVFPSRMLARRGCGDGGLRVGEASGSKGNSQGI